MPKNDQSQWDWMDVHKGYTDVNLSSKQSLRGWSYVNHCNDVYEFGL